MRKLITFNSESEFSQFLHRLPRSVRRRCRCFPRMKVMCLDEKDYNRVHKKISGKSDIAVEDEGSYKLHVKDKIPWGVRKVKAPRAWSKAKGEGVKVGILDTGIDRTHPDLSSRVAGGIDVLEHANPFRDLNGHGTHIAGIIAASLNSIGVAGIAPNASLYAIRAFSAEGTGSTADIIEGIDWAINNNIDILNMSFGSSKGSKAEKNAIDAALDSGIFIIAAAGNGGGKVDFPARYSGVVGVGAISRDNQIPPFSNRGKGINFVEPGVKILSTWPGDSYRKLDGTSMSAAHLSGIAAIFLSLYPRLSQVELYKMLRRSSVSLSKSPRLQGSGVVTLSKLPKGRLR